MNSIKLGIFDIFAYALPGSVFLFTIFMLWGYPVQNITNIHVLFKDMKFSQLVLYVVLSYLIGFSLDSIGSIFFYKVIFKLFKNNPREKNKEKYSLNKDQVLEILMLIREKSPKNN